MIKIFNDITKRIVLNKEDKMRLALIFCLSLFFSSPVHAEQRSLDNSSKCKVKHSNNLRPGSRESTDYKGGCVHGIANGNGSLTYYLDGKQYGIYEGNFKNGSFNGSGILDFSFKDGEGFHYKGNFKNGIFHGKGTIVGRDCSKSTGDWLNGEKHGVAVYTDPDGHTYTQIWNHGKKLRSYKKSK